jgi:hypothetical protein
LAFGEKEFGKGVGVEKSDDGASQTAPDGTNADGAEFVRIIGILRKGEKATISQILSEFGGDFIVEDQREKFGKEAEAFRVVGLVRGGQTKGLNGIGEIAKRAVGGARLELNKGVFDNFRGDGDARMVTGRFTSAGMGMGMDAGRVEGFAEGFDVICHGGNWKG